MIKHEATFTQEDFALFIGLTVVTDWLKKLLFVLSKKHIIRIAENLEPNETGPQITDGIWIVFNTVFTRTMIKIITPWGSIDYCDGTKEIADIFNNTVSTMKELFKRKYEIDHISNSGIKKILIFPAGKISAMRDKKIPHHESLAQWRAMSEVKRMITNKI